MKKRATALCSLVLCLALGLSACTMPFSLDVDFGLGLVDDSAWGEPASERRTIPYGEMVYERPDLDALRASIQEMTPRLAGAPDYETVTDVIDECGALMENYNTMYVLAMLAKYHDVNDTYFEEEYRLLEEAGVELETLLNDFNRAILEGPFAEDYRAEIGDYHFQSLQNDLLLNSPEVEEYKKERAQLDTDYNKLLTRLGEGNYDENAPQFAEMYARMIELDRLTAQTLGFASPAEMYYLSYARDYTPQQGLALCENSKRIFAPLLPTVASDFYNSGVAEMDPAFAQMPVSLAKLHPQLREAWDFMIEYGMYDCEPLPGKQAGIAFSTDLYAYDTAFIFSNWEYNFRSVTTMMHEFGHFYSSWLSYDDDVVFNLDVAEVYSQGLELLMHPYYGDFTGAAYAREAEMENLQSFVLNVLIYQSLLEEFQFRVYELETLDAASIGHVYAELMEEYGLRADTDENDADNSWYRVTHLFDAPFYTVSYVSSALAALQIWAESQTDYAEGVQIYLDLIHADQNQSFESLLTGAGLRPVHDTATQEEIAQHFVRVFG